MNNLLNNLLMNNHSLMSKLLLFFIIFLDLQTQYINNFPLSKLPRHCTFHINPHQGFDPWIQQYIHQQRVFSFQHIGQEHCKVCSIECQMHYPHKFNDSEIFLEFNISFPCLDIV